MSSINFTAHGLSEGQPIKFANVLPDDTGIDENATYYVIADNLTADTFEFSETPGGVSFVLASDITSGDVINPEEYTALEPEEEPSNVQQGWTTVRDIEPPSIPGGLATTPTTNGMFVKWNATTANDLAFFELRYAIDDGTGTGPDVEDWTTVRCKTTSAYIGNLPADTNADGTADSRYWFAVRAVDTTGNVSAWQASNITAVAATNVITLAAHRFIEGDLVRFGKDINGLLDETDYYVIADSLTSTTLKVSLTLGGAEVDITSDIVAADALTISGYPVYRDYSNDAEAGWTIPVSGDPALVGSDDITYQSIGTEHVKVVGLSAEVIKTGTLNLNTTDANMADGIKVYNDDGDLIGLWNETGLYIYSEDDSTDYVRLYDGGISIFIDGVEYAALTPDGVNAGALTFGTLPGGHNVVLNSGFELSDFAAEPSTATWTALADWSGTAVSETNITEGAGALTVTALAY